MSSTSIDPDIFSGLVDRIVEFRAGGHSVDAIAAKVGCSPTKVRKILREYAAQKYAKRQELLDEVAMSLDLAKREYLKLFTDGIQHRDRRGALEGFVKVVESQRKFFGLDAPTRTEIKAVEDWSDEELVSRARELGIEVDTECLLPANPLRILPAAADEDARLFDIDRPVAEADTLNSNTAIDDPAAAE